MCGLLSDIDDCISVTCNNGGTCEDGMSSFTCVCSYGYTGKFCDTGKQKVSFSRNKRKARGSICFSFLTVVMHLQLSEQQQRTYQRRRWMPKTLIDVAMSFPACEMNLISRYVPQFSLQLSW